MSLTPHTLFCTYIFFYIKWSDENTINTQFWPIGSQQLILKAIFLRVHNIFHWRIQRGGSKPLFFRRFCQDRVKITHFESGTPLWKPKIIVEPPLKTQLNGRPTPLSKIPGSATGTFAVFLPSLLSLNERRSSIALRSCPSLTIEDKRHNQVLN